MPSPQKQKKSSRVQRNTADRLKELANNTRVTILLDTEDLTDEARMGAFYSYNEKTHVLQIAVNNLKPQDREVVYEIIREQFEKGEVILKDTKQETLKSYSEYQHRNEYKNTLEFFNGIIPKDDFYALKMSLYLRSEKEKGHNKYISVYKKDIRNRFGDRGANIANLCSAGYFEKELMPLFNSVPKQVFDEYYEIVVGKKARALFVYSEMLADELQTAFDEMLEKALKYHMDDFRVHGIGKQNVDKLKEFFAMLATSKDDRFIVRKSFEIEQPYSAIEYSVKIT